MKSELATVGFSCGHHYLEVAGIVLAMEGDACRTTKIPIELEEPIPEEELNSASIGGKPIKEMDPAVVRFFRGSRWNKAMLEWTANQINRKQV